MSQVEEQEMEAEALTAIFDTQFQILQGDSPPFEWLIELWPETEANDNHVGVQLKVTLPETYPDSAVPLCDIIVLKGLTQDHAAKLLELAQEEAMNNEGVPSVFAICERLREWLVEHNQKGHDDISMHAQMLRREAEAERKEQQQQVSFFLSSPIQRKKGEKSLIFFNITRSGERYYLSWQYTEILLLYILGTR